MQLSFKIVEIKDQGILYFQENRASFRTVPYYTQKACPFIWAGLLYESKFRKYAGFSSHVSFFFSKIRVYLADFTNPCTLMIYLFTHFTEQVKDKAYYYDSYNDSDNDASFKNSTYNFTTSQ